MNIEVWPRRGRFDDVATMLGPKNPDSSVCWCLSHRIDSKTNRALVGRARGEYVKTLCGRPVAPGVLAYEDLEVVGWAAVAPGPSCLSRGRPRFPISITCPSGQCGASVSAPATAARHRTPCWTVRWRTRGQRVRPRSRATPWTTRARRSTARWPMSALRKLFEDAGFTKAADTNAVSGGFPRVLMRLELG